MGFRHGHSPDDLNNTLLSLGCGNGGRNVCSQDRVVVEKPLTARVYFPGQLMVTSS